MKKVKDLYEAPSTKVVELKTQSIICQSYNAAVNATLFNDGVFVEEDILL